MQNIISTKKTLNLVFDVSNMMFRSLFMVPAKHSVNIKKFSKEEDISNFIIKLTRDISFIIRKYGAFARTIFVCDAKDPWRKKIIEDLPVGYKGARKKDNNIDWDNVFESVNQLKEVLKIQGFPVLEIENTEADDIMALLKDSLFHGTTTDSIVFVTSDEDIRQLIDFNKETSQFVTCLNPISKKNDISASKTFYITKGIEEYCFNKSALEMKEKQQKEHDIFNPAIAINTSKSIIHNLLTKDRTTYEVIDPNDIVLRKVFCGDDGDSVPALYSFYTKNNRLKRITNSIYLKIKEDLNLNDTSDLDKFQNTPLNESSELDESVKSKLKLKALDYSPTSLIKRQRVLVELDPSLFPDKTIKIYKEQFADLSSKFDSDYKIINKSDITYEDILAGTSWLEYSKETPDNKVLKDINKYLKTNKMDELFDKSKTSVSELLF